MVRTFQLTLAATQKRLSDVYGGAAGVLDPKTDIPYRYLVLQAEAAAAYLGSDPTTLATNNYGAKIDNTNTGQGFIIGAFDAGPIRLSDLYALGAGSTLHVLGIPF